MSSIQMEEDEGVLRLSLNRPASMNAINRQLLIELGATLEQYRDDPMIKALVLFGQGRCFAAGADIKELASLDEKGIREFHHIRETVFSRLESFPAPTIAVIERYALGTGLELALCCDFRIAGDDARMGVPSAGLGLVESYEYFARLLRAVGSSWAKRMVFTGERLDAAAALSIGLIEETTSSARLFARAEEILAHIQRNFGLSIRNSKTVIDACRKDLLLSRVGDTARPLVESMQSDDFREGTRAFLEKRKPVPKTTPAPKKGEA
jgi:enoyl-CoA hydratase/carnithine racemase